MRAPGLVILAAAAVAVLVGGCGSAGSPAASRPTPPAPVTLSAYIGPRTVRLSPARLGAGPVLLTVADRGSGTAALVIAHAGTRGTLARTEPIDSGGVTQLKVDLTAGRYTVAAVTTGHRSEAQRTRALARAPTTVLRVGALRPGGGDQVLQP